MHHIQVFNRPMGKALKNACVLDSAQQICDVLEQLAKAN